MGSLTEQQIGMMIAFKSVNEWFDLLKIKNNKLEMMLNAVIDSLELINQDDKRR